MLCIGTGNMQSCEEIDGSMCIGQSTTEIYVSLRLGSNLLLDLVLGQCLELGASTNEVSTEVDVGDSTLSVERLEVGLDGI